MSIVYALQEQNKDFSSALSYSAKIQFLFPDGNIRMQPIDIERELRVKLDNYHPQKDFFILSGDPIAIAIAGYVLMERHDVVTFLKYDRHINSYSVVKWEV
jgi:hypothetical protein